MVCAMHRLFQSEEDDLIMEGKDCQNQTAQETPPADAKEALKTKLGARLLKSLKNRWKKRTQ